MMRNTLRMLGCSLLMAGSAHAAGVPDGKALFTERCGMCHLTNGMGVGLARAAARGRQQGLAREPHGSFRGSSEGGGAQWHHQHAAHFARRGE